jgi:hypothetical protein
LETVSFVPFSRVTDPEAEDDEAGKNVEAVARHVGCERKQGCAPADEHHPSAMAGA